PDLVGVTPWSGFPDVARMPAAYGRLARGVSPRPGPARRVLVVSARGLWNPRRAAGRVIGITAVTMLLSGWASGAPPAPGGSTGAVLKAGVIVAGDVPAAWTSVP